MLRWHGRIAMQQWIGAVPRIAHLHLRLPIP
jgi:hypothetical protein